MLYAIIGRDVPGTLAQRLAIRSVHLERLNTLSNEGRLILAGPLPAIDSPDPGPAGFVGSLLVAEFATLEDARTWAETDPYVAAGVWGAVEVHPFRKVLPV